MLRITFYILFILVAYLSLRSNSHQFEIQVNDKFGHGLAYFVLMLNGGLAFEKKKTSIIAVSLFLFGILVEILQGYIPNRSSSFLDLVANSTGIILGLSILYIFGAPIQSLLKSIGLSKK